MTVLVRIGSAPVFEAERIGSPWNGWATPAFRLEVMRQVAAYFGLAERGQDNGPSFFIEEYPYKGEEPDTVNVSQDGLYRPDGWVWMVVCKSGVPLSAHVCTDCPPEHIQAKLGPERIREAKERELLRQAAAVQHVGKLLIDQDDPKGAADTMTADRLNVG